MGRSSLDALQGIQLAGLCTSTALPGPNSLPVMTPQQLYTQNAPGSPSPVWLAPTQQDMGELYTTTSLPNAKTSPVLATQQQCFQNSSGDPLPVRMAPAEAAAPALFNIRRQRSQSYVSRELVHCIGGSRSSCNSSARIY